MTLKIPFQIAVLPLPSHPGIQSALGGEARGIPLVQAFEAAQAINALAQLRFPALLDLFAPLLIRQPTATHRHEVLHAVGQELLRHSRLPDGGNADDRDMHVVFDSLDELPPPTLRIGNRLHAGDAGLIQAHGYINKINAHGLQSHGNFYAVLDMDVVLTNTSFIQKFLYTEADTDGEIGAAGFADAGNDLREHPQAVFKAAAVLILPLIGIGRQELLE